MNFKSCYYYCSYSNEIRAICLVRICQFLIFVCMECVGREQVEQWKHPKNLAVDIYGSLSEQSRTGTDGTLLVQTTENYATLSPSLSSPSPITTVPRAFNQPPINAEEVARLQAEIIRLSQFLSFYDRCYYLMHEFVKQCYGPADFIKDTSEDKQSNIESGQKSKNNRILRPDHTAASINKFDPYNHNPPNRFNVHNNKSRRRENRKHKRPKSRKNSNVPMLR